MQSNVKSLTDLANLIEQQESKKQDYIYSTKNIKMVNDNSLQVADKGEYFVGKIAHEQISERLNIPRKYYERMVEVPGLRSHNVNSWFQHNSEHRLVRTLDGKARAFLSDRFRPIDNFYILHGFLPVLNDMQVQIKATTLTEEKMYLQIVFPSLQEEILPGDVVSMGIVLTNSEVGRGAVDVSVMLWRLVCSNGAIGESLINKYHTGRRVGDMVEDYNIFKNDTVMAELNSFQKRIRDILAHAVTETCFMQLVTQARKAAACEIKDVVKTVGNVTRHYDFSDKEKELVLNNFITDKTAGANRWGLVNSITALAHQIENHERQFEVEKIGFNLINVEDAEWQKIA